jgi:hypothetical protein
LQAHGGLDYKKGARCNPVQSAESGGALATPSESAIFQQCCDISSSSCVVSCISVTLYLYSLYLTSSVSTMYSHISLFAWISLLLYLSSPVPLFPTSHFFCVYPVFAYISLCLDLSSPVSLFHDFSLFLCLPYIELQFFGLTGIIALLPISQSVHYAIASVEERS